MFTEKYGTERRTKILAFNKSDIEGKHNELLDTE